MQGESSLDILTREENVGERVGLPPLALLGRLPVSLSTSYSSPRRWTGRSSSSATGSFFFFLRLHHGIAKIPGADGP